MAQVHSGERNSGYKLYKGENGERALIREKKGGTIQKEKEKEGLNNTKDS